MLYDYEILCLFSLSPLYNYQNLDITVCLWHDFECLEVFDFIENEYDKETDNKNLKYSASVFYGTPNERILFNFVCFLFPSLKIH